MQPQNKYKCNSPWIALCLSLPPFPPPWLQAAVALTVACWRACGDRASSTVKLHPTINHTCISRFSLKATNGSVCTKSIAVVHKDTNEQHWLNKWVSWMLEVESQWESEGERGVWDRETFSPFIFASNNIVYCSFHLIPGWHLSITWGVSPPNQTVTCSRNADWEQENSWTLCCIHDLSAISNHHHCH